MTECSVRADSRFVNKSYARDRVHGRLLEMLAIRRSVPGALSAIGKSTSGLSAIGKLTSGLLVNRPKVLMPARSLD